jgi:glutamine amidotransferase
MIGIIDYGMGNLYSVEKAFARLGYPAVVSANRKELERADAIVLPGVGAFADAISSLQRLELDELIRQEIQKGKPFLGICLGLQLLFERSEENGSWEGLGIFSGRVKKFPQGLKVPHMGWNNLKMTGNCPLFNGVPDGSRFYFVHSYYVEAENPDIVTAVADYGNTFTAAVGWNKVFALQFHPEKSSTLGLKILQNFGEMVGCS